MAALVAALDSLVAALAVDAMRKKILGWLLLTIGWLIVAYFFLRYVLPDIIRQIQAL